MGKIFLIVVLAFLLSYDFNAKPSIYLKTKGEYEHKINNPCLSADCTPRALSTPYHRIVFTERKRIDKVVFKDFIGGLVYKKVITENDYRNVNFDDNFNSLTILIRNSILIVNPDSGGSGVKSIEYRFESCNQISDFDKNNVRNILNLIGNPPSK